MTPILTKTERLKNMLAGALFGQAGETRSEGRSLARCRVKTRVAVHWREADGQKTLTASSVDMSEYGASIESSRLIAPGTNVWVEFKDLRLTGSAHIRHCTPRGSKHRIGLSFSGPLMRPL